MNSDCSADESNSGQHGEMKGQFGNIPHNGKGQEK